MSDCQLIVEIILVSATLFNALRLAEKSLLNQSGAQPPKIVSCVALPPATNSFGI